MLSVSGTLKGGPYPVGNYAGIMGWTKENYLSNRKKLLASFRKGEGHFDFIKSIIDELKVEIEEKKFATWKELETSPKELAKLLKKAKKQK